MRSPAGIKIPFSPDLTDLIDSSDLILGRFNRDALGLAR
jgi:hypothetical protein